ncbi:MAG: NADH-quinone oxidoreductase subunit L [Planctomycetia bacterium]
MLTPALVLLLAPLGGFVVQYFLGRRLPRQGDWLTLLTIGTSLACAVSILLTSLDRPVGFSETVWSAAWMNPGTGAPWTVSITIDGLTAVMLFVVTLVAFLVHLFSVGYMHGDPKYWLFFAWLQMFSVAMLILVLAGNLLHLFIGWELVGLCSYKLIGFWSEKKAPGNASRKAFITTRIGDVGMLVAIMAIYQAAGSFEFPAIFAAAQQGLLTDGWMLVAALGIFFAAVGKSAQLPLHVWLPDAMEGPTPVSALIHAATMVAAGVYLVARMMPIFPPEALAVVAAVGGVTALMAGLVAVAQNDIKKVLAYSTVSQLGYMFLGLGCGAWHAGLFHLTTHAFFKALMFLGSGSVIHACHHEQDMRKMGGLLRKLPLTGITFGIGVLAIAGVPFLSGFYSKDAILAAAWHRFPALFWLGLGSALLTAFYMTRLFVGTFLGQPKDAHVHEHAHEGPLTMKLPLLVLAVLSVVAGYGAWHTDLLAPPLGERAAGVIERFDTVGDTVHFEHSGFVAMLATAAGALGLLLGLVVFRALATATKDALRRPLAPLEAACASKFWFDELYRDLFLRPAYALARLFAWTDGGVVDGAVNGAGALGRTGARVSGAADRNVVDGAVRGSGGLAWLLGGIASRLQGGRVRAYLGWSVAAVALFLVLRQVF